MPPDSLLEAYPGALRKKCTYAIKTLEHAVRQAAGISTVLGNAIISKPGPQPEPSLILSHYAVWLCDFIQPLISYQLSWPEHVDIGVASTLQIAFDIAVAHGSSNGPGLVVAQKANITLTIACSEVFQQPQQLLSKERHGKIIERVVSLALIHLSKQALAHRPLSMLVASKLVPTLHQLKEENRELDDTDLGVSLVTQNIVYCTDWRSVL